MTDPALPRTQEPTVPAPGTAVPGRHDLPSAPERLPAPGLAAPHVTTYPVSFTGSTGEYFRLWIVNAALSVVTLGIYLPWARVRNRQYFYGHTWVDGQNFEYRADPLKLLRSYVVVGALFGAFTLTQQSERLWGLSVLIGLVFALLYPWLVAQSMRFQAVNTVHRGLRFHFDGSLKGAYVAYGAANVAASVSSGLALPWAWFMQRRYQIDNLRYGSARGLFRGDVAPMYLIALTGVGLLVGAGLLLGVPAVVALVAWMAGNGFDLDSMDWDSLGSGLFFLIFVAVAYVILISLNGVAWQYVRAATMRYVLNNAELGGVVRTGATFNPWRVVWITVSNGAAQLLTLGLATPWADIRRNRYLLEGVSVRAIAPLDDFARGTGGPESALGEAATELLDIGLGF
ncbi:YjgN family protein [Deinococcus knuensis]|uniref:YjgN family protein n=1 Tax=Deinococcus knuensis TaxID=1837380 RepID=UPI001666BB84|nr:YjgN family protein [Deinococcus knuensis]